MSLPSASLDRLTKIGATVHRLILPDPFRKDFLSHAQWTSTLYETVKPDPAVIAFTGRVACLNVIAAAIRNGPVKTCPTSPASWPSSTRCSMTRFVDTLDEGLPRVYTPDLYDKKCSVIFEHVFENFPDADTTA